MIVKVLSSVTFLAQNKTIKLLIILSWQKKDVFKEIKALLDLRVYELSNVKLKKYKAHVNSTHSKMKKKNLKERDQK